MAVRKSNNVLQSKIIPFIKKYGIWIVVLIGLLLVVPYIYKLILQFQQKINDAKTAVAETKNDSENSNANPAVIKKKTEALKKKYVNIPDAKLNEIQGASIKIAEYLGTNVQDSHKLFQTYSWLPTIELFNVRALVEDEKSALSVLKKYPGTFPVLEEFYYSTATLSRNLKADILKYFDKKEVSALSAHYKKYGYSWF